MDTAHIIFNAVYDVVMFVLGFGHGRIFERTYKFLA